MVPEYVTLIRSSHCAPSGLLKHIWNCASLIKIKTEKGTKLVHDLAIVSPLCGDERTALLCICLDEMLLKCDVATTDMRCNCKCMT